jgi:hypothetical protein
MSELFDKAMFEMILAKAEEVLRPIGLTLIQEGSQAMYQQGQAMMMLPCLVRSEGVERVQKDQIGREEFNKMMAANHQAALQEEAERIRKLAESGNIESVLFGDESLCEHLRIHPEGFCIDCGEVPKKAGDD